MTRGTLKLDTNNRGYSEKKFKGLINCNVRNIVKVVTSLLAKLMVVQIFKNHLSYLTGWIVFETLFKKRANENGWEIFKIGRYSILFLTYSYLLESRNQN